MSDTDSRDQRARRIEVLEVGDSAAEAAPPRPRENEPAAAPADRNAVDAAELAGLQQELEDLRDRSLRTLADYENYRKRVEREKAEDRRYAGIEVLREVLAVVDNLERAAAAPGSVDELKAGVELILRQLHDLLRRHGVLPVAAAGEAFDPNVHEAVSREHDAGVERPTVTAEHQRGYKMRDRLLRPAVVSVALPIEEGDQATQSQEP
ncbi:MAG: nucleotide exchange factor GrpE [Thermoanaerobaculia bacterium]